MAKPKSRSGQLVKSTPVPYPWVEPVYPEIARQTLTEGIVILEATTDIYGRVKSVRVLG